MSDNLRIFQTDDLDALFWPPSRYGVPSAWYAHVPFAHWLVSRSQPRLVVELGTHNGVSYSAFCEAVARRRLPTACFAVDTWLGDQHAGYYGEEVYGNLKLFNDARYAGFSQLLRCTFDEALPYFAEATIDLLHIDALHTYEAGKHDFDSWLPKLSDRAVVLFHDTNVREREFGIWKLFGELKQQYPTFEFLHGHGLGVAAVGRNVPAAVATLCALEESAVSAVRERFSSIGGFWAAEGPWVGSNGSARKAGASRAKLRDGSAPEDSAMAEMGSLETEFPGLGAVVAQLEQERARNDSAVAEIESLRAELSRLNAAELRFNEERAHADSMISEIESLKVQLLKLDRIETRLEEERARAETFAKDLEAIRNGLCSVTNYQEHGSHGSRGGIASWKDCEDAYQVWKLYKRREISKDEAIREIDRKYGVRSFFFRYPFFMVARFFRKLFKSKNSECVRTGVESTPPPVDFDARWYLKNYPDVMASGLDPLFHYLEFGRAEGRLGCPPRMDIEVSPNFDPARKTVLLISHDASQTGAPILAFNLLEKLARRYNVVSVLLAPGTLEDAFRNVSAATIGPFSEHLRYTVSIHDPIHDACRKFAPAFAIVNSIESRETLVPLSEAGVPSVLLVHEFSTLCPRLDMRRVISSAGQIVFPARRVWEDAVEVFPWLAAHPANILTQGQTRIPREWLGGETPDDEEKRIAAVMRPDGPDDDAIVVIGCGYIDMRKGIDLFISVASSLLQRSPSRRYRFVWVGKAGEDLYSSFIATQVKCCNLNGTVHFLGEVNSLAPVYAMADVFLLSSRLDPFPNVAIQAMLAGIPVVCFKGASGVAEMLSGHDDLKNLVLPYLDVAAAATEIERLGENASHLQRTGSTIRNLAAASFDMDRYVEGLEELAERAALVMKQEEEDCATIAQSGLIMETYAIPFDLCLPAGQYVKHHVGESAGCGGTRCPFPGFHPGIYRNEHPELNAPPFVNPLAHFIRSGEPHGPWLLDIIKPEESVSDPVTSELTTALHVHIHYPELTSEIFSSLHANRTRPDLFITVSSREGLDEVTRTAGELAVDIREISIVPNRGRDIGPLLTLLGERIIRDYQIIGHLHAKRSTCLPEPYGEKWRGFCLENLLGKQHPMMDIILERFGRDPRLGLVFPSDPNICGWTQNRPKADDLLKRMGLAIDLPDEFFFPVGTMFWARTDAIAPLLQMGLGWSDYPPEPLPYDGTILHAIERLLPIVARQRDYRIAGTFIPGVTR